MMTSPGDRIVRELGQLPPRDRMNVVVEVMQRLGMTTTPETGFLTDAGKRWAIVGAAVFAFGMTVAVPHALEYESPPEAWLDLTTSPADAQVLIDARPIGEHLGWRIGTKAGRHLLTVMKAGYVPSDQYIEIPLNDVVRKKVSLRIAETTGLAISSEPPGLLIKIDDRPVGRSPPARTPFRATRIEPGLHVVEVVSDSGAVWRRGIDVVPDQLTEVHAIVGR